MTISLLPPTTVDDEMIYLLERVIDRYTLSQTVSALAKICDEKSEHVATIWQDTTTAKQWTRAAFIMQMTTTRVSQECGL